MIHDYEATKPITTDAFIPGEDMREKTISTLNGLIAICKHGEAGFREAAENVERTDLKQLFAEFSGQRSQFAGGLQALVKSLDGDPEESGNLSASLHRAWIDVKGAFTGKDDAAALSECERGEDSAKKAYKEALATELPDFVRETVQKQYDSVLVAHDRVKAIRDVAKSTSAKSGK
ncbi:MAG: ferritin-like domain-containing protein [Pyrinomonadaceae bacterium]